MLRATSILSILTWSSILVGATVVMWPIARPSYKLQYAVVLVFALSTTVLSTVMLIRNRPFCLGVSFLLSVAGGIVFGIVGVGVFVYCILSVLAPGSFTRPSGVEWFYGVNNAIMLALPICWAFLWRDHRNNVTDKHLTMRWS
jgi:hypothetical protein